ncbi:MAG: hypothetical protein COT91_00800 [Candidatus Doudnabacteria bacterium CG10_big_fil_rev_8_21_14_0_10_41_10]|uniref:Ribulose-phosphate 3-epimerase n=1 Tax=Candidatus Doudnabacteria bacterium CG10_big_fil_rev_8_21_14_0_10_41_10 TaxID=1974551 RepID=A0A2H0VEM0_9BACT|nr:MAG: hypothetical protein COT91_00800 [Candidatus Doudnabacteria bacterium CG10_big_fil_rev_8_21_14_0_10_41_10]
MKTEIIPSILVKNENEFDKRYRVVSQHAKTAQLDVLDNSFLPYSSFHDVEYIATLKPKINIEVHFMINNVAGELPKWNYSWVSKIIFHIEATPNAEILIETIKSMGKKVGIAINPETSVLQIQPYIKKVNTVLVMTVHPGRNGAPFVPETLEKVKEIRNENPKVNIEVDGGMNLENVKSAKDAGANLFVVGSYLSGEKFGERLKELVVSSRASAKQSHL